MSGFGTESKSLFLSYLGSPQHDLQKNNSRSSIPNYEIIECVRGGSTDLKLARNFTHCVNEKLIGGPLAKTL